MSLRILPLTLLLATPSIAFAGPGGDLPWTAGDPPREGTARLWAQVQAWATVMDQDSQVVADPTTYGDPELDPGFTIPRARMGVAGMLPNRNELFQAHYGVGFGVGSRYDGINLGDSDAQIVDAYGDLVMANGFGPTSLTVGVHRIPFSRDLLQSSRQLTFQERSVAATEMGHGRDAGMTLTQGVNVGDDGMVAVRLGAFNGNGSFEADTDPGLLLAARAELAIGNAYQTFDADLEPAVGIGANILNNNQLSSNITRYGGDLLLRYKWITATGEYLLGGIAPGDSNAVAPAVSDTINQSGLSAQLSFFVPIADTKSGPEIAGRFSTFDDDADTQDIGDVQILHAGLNWRNVVPRMDAGAGFIHRMEGGNVEYANDTARLWVQFRPSAKVALADDDKKGGKKKGGKKKG